MAGAARHAIPQRAIRLDAYLGDRVELAQYAHQWREGRGGVGVAAGAPVGLHARPPCAEVRAHAGGLRGHRWAQVVQRQQQKEPAIRLSVGQWPLPQRLTLGPLRDDRPGARLQPGCGRRLARVEQVWRQPHRAPQPQPGLLAPRHLALARWIQMDLHPRLLRVAGRRIAARGPQARWGSDASPPPLARHARRAAPATPLRRWPCVSLSLLSLRSLNASASH